jgi:selenocysteine lyase/cysteine desulfurase
VIDRLARFYSHENSNIHRAAHTLDALVQALLRIQSGRGHRKFR